VGGLRSERWAPSPQNSGRLEIGMGGRDALESAQKTRSPSSHRTSRRPFSPAMGVCDDALITGQCWVYHCAKATRPPQAGMGALTAPTRNVVSRCPPLPSDASVTGSSFACVRLILIERAVLRFDDVYPVSLLSAERTHRISSSSSNGLPW
jgi:hypothetical protein